MAAPPRSLADVMLEIEHRATGSQPFSSWGAVQPTTNPVSDYSALRPPVAASTPYRPLRQSSGALYELPAGPRSAPLNDLGSSGKVYAQVPNRAALPPSQIAGELGPGTAPRAAFNDLGSSGRVWAQGTGAAEPLALGPGSPLASALGAEATAGRAGLLTRLAPGAMAARAGEGGYMAALRGVNPISAEAAAAGGKFLGVQSGSALVSGSGMAKTLAGVGKGALGPALAGMAVAPVLKAGGGALMGGEDTRGWDQYDAGQGLTGAGDALPVTAGLGGAAVALGASGPVGWGIAGLGALGYGIYSMFTNDDDKSVVKRESATGAEYLDNFAAQYGDVNPDIVARYATRYADELRNLDDPGNKEARTAVMLDIQTRMEKDIQEERNLALYQQDEALTQQNVLAQQKLALELMAPYIQQFQSGNAMVDAAYAQYDQGLTGRAAQLAEISRTTDRQMNDRLALAAAQEAVATPAMAAQQAAYIRQLEQQQLAQALALEEAKAKNSAGL